MLIIHGEKKCSSVHLDIDEKILELLRNQQLTNSTQQEALSPFISRTYE